MYLNIKAYSQESFDAFYEIVIEDVVRSQQYIIDEVFYKGVKITLYTTLTVLIKGDVSNIMEEIDLLIDTKMYVGVDELGVGENIGPYVVCAVKFNDYKSKVNVVLHGIKDSKKMSHKEIIDASKVIMKNSKYECIGLAPSDFNKEYSKIKNMKALNAIAQNDLHMKFKDDPNHVTDEFVNQRKYFEYLSNFGKEPFEDIFFTTKAEDKFVEVAAAAIISKAKYNNWLIDYLDKHNIYYKIDKKLNSNEIWTRIKNNKIILKDRNELVKDWSK